MSNLIKLTNARLAIGDNLVPGALWVDPVLGVFVSPPNNPAPSMSTIDLQNRIVAPGFLDLQINGAYGFDFSEDTTAYNAGESYDERLREVRRKLIATGTTSFLPTMTSQLPDRYHQNLPFLGPSRSRDPFDGTESLGAHCEGPFFANNRMGVHLPDAILATGSTSEPEKVFETYGAVNLIKLEGISSKKQCGSIPSHVRMITLAPERPGALDTIRKLSTQGITMSIGHMAASYAQSQSGIDAGATMITHLYNQMNGHHHREPGPLGLLSGVLDINPRNETKILDVDCTTGSNSRPYFGIIADGSHVHPASVRLAHSMHPDGLVLVTDALLLLGGEDGTIDWLTRRLTKKGVSVKLEGTDIIAGRLVALLLSGSCCLNNFRRWTGVSIPVALQAITSRPAAVLGLESVKGTLQEGADADFVVLDEKNVSGQSTTEIAVDQVWKFGVKVIDSSSDKTG
ncbi:carbohydrate esterase family 9 protein [Penicillium macrosclerotiorum]|uniref:carbohydrate esterase family 9 protein n=1 Tax=Penicillium macrosclerotiorum TaxID=303699 RepID=UPI002547EE96|nr:carbohydrate esterase family 9 protein [Penicillium macrosclerotiorum]KAJ5692745.1 carbohydrate esterase family 9 protein [Penicillium macrosclerotiorum]